MGSTGLDPDLIAANIQAARDRKAQALAEYEAASAELSWWLQGAKLAGIATLSDEDDQNNVPDDLFPPARYFDETEERPTLRQAIMAHLSETPTASFTVAELAQALVRRGWLPENGAQKRVSDLAGVMHGDEQLQRVDRGVYRLHPRFALAFERRPHGAPEPPTDRDMLGERE
jgi:hypothetical protein